MLTSQTRVLVSAILFVLAGTGLSGASPRVSSAAAPPIGLSTIGGGGWEVVSSSVATQTGSAISTPGFSTSSWLAVTPDDGGAPGTDIEAILQKPAQAQTDGLITAGCATTPSGTTTNLTAANVFFSMNMKQCLGYLSGIGPIKKGPFAVPWWYRTDFTGGIAAGQDATLVVNGVVGQADVWLNGTELATQSSVQGDYTRYTFDITNQLLSGDNALALEVYPNDPNSMYTLDNVDWTQIPPDNNTGIQFPVQLHISNALGLSNTRVLENNATNLSSSQLTIKADVTNHSASSQTGTVAATVTAPGGTSPLINVSQSVTVPANTTQTVQFATQTISSPQVWWPYQLGAQPLYTLGVTLSTNGFTPTESISKAFGIRTVSTYLTGVSTMTPNGVRVFSINGVPIIFRGGGWSENLFLHYLAPDTATQILLMKNLGVNGIRTEGHQMPDDFYQQMDKAGILIDGGFQCCDFWQTTSSLTTQNYNVYQNSSQTIGQNMLDHPSVINFSWSDNAPSSQQETYALNGFKASDFYPQNPLISSAEYKTDPQGILGPSGEKEGPYDWVPPSYWYDTTHYSSDTTLTNAGGSWAFDSEESAGDTIPTMDSIQRWLSSTEQTNLWTSPTYNQYHLNYESGYSGYKFGTVHNLNAAIQPRYGNFSNLAQYVQEAQVQNYEDTRAQFEAFIDHWNNATPSTGTVYWQMNKGWPSMLWDLYNYDYDQAGSYFGAKKANETLHALYTLDNGTVTVDNLGAAAQSGLVVTSKVYDINGNLLDQQTSATLSVASQVVVNNVLTPKVPATNSTPVQTYFVELTMSQNGTTVDRNVYWLSTQPDVPNWNKTIGSPQASMNQYANMTALQSLPATTVTVTSSTTTSGSQNTTTVTITNPSTSKTVAFFVRADVRRGSGTTEQTGDNQVLPITWSDNDITLWPGESQTLTATYSQSLLNGASPVVSIQGWNVSRFDVAG